jgi:hypothetical protein
MGTDEFFLVVAAEPNDDVLSLLAKVFMPFDAGLWIGIIVTCAAIGFSMWLFGEISGPDATAAPGTKPISKLAKEVAVGTLIGMKAAVQTFVGQGKLKVKSKPAGIVLAGFGFLCMVGGASYTASLSSALLLSSLKTQFTDVADAVMQKASICVPASLETILTAKFPEGADLWVTIPTHGIGNITAEMDAGSCSCMILSQQWYDAMRAGAVPFDEKHCRKVKVGDSIISIPLAAPIRPDLNQAMAHLMAEARFDGVHNALAEKYPPLESDCPPIAGLKAKFEGLKPQDLSACFLFTWIAIAVAIFVHKWQQHHKTAQAVVSRQVSRVSQHVRRELSGGCESRPPASPDPSDTDPSIKADGGGVLLDMEVDGDKADDLISSERDVIPRSGRHPPSLDGNIMEKMDKMAETTERRMAALEGKMDKILEILSSLGGPRVEPQQSWNGL